ncbi:MAG TPA: hypothetical protein VGH72_33985 [Pseudonocardia sp.]
MTHQQPQGGPLSNLAISLIRTGVPLLWGYAVAWAISLGIPATFLATYHDLAVNALGAVLTFAWYALWRWAETKVPQLDSWAARLVVVFALGHPSAPNYQPAPVADSVAPKPSATV